MEDGGRGIINGVLAQLFSFPALAFLDISGDMYGIPLHGGG